MNEPQESDLATAVISSRKEIEGAMKRYFAKEIGSNPASHAYAAGRLVDILIGSLGPRTDGGANAVASAIPPAYYTMFGDALIPVLKDVIGNVASPTIISKSIDSYWRAVRCHQIA
ncbi:hypothetical protein KRR38_31870 [Novosphingobium sp. G106]|uniref:hypothetical protein n=1 Tax=Novosphingobium sp. G106 TaxID=2849500 RepID=UPI001C2D4F34|nr:hypothetical protein [Novosphingobium sp. G106]MBV1691828.1 hypothetical protein [Novosphingobium sp. G106]MBV1692143.1 hypothetical protein [Novosphingobium sp. G106]